MGEDMIVCKMPNAVMRYFDAEEELLSAFIAPRDYCGYVVLINCAESKESNCYCAKVVVSNCMRILIMAKRGIKAGE